MLCGPVTVWTAPTGTATGALTIAGTAYVVATNTALVGAGNIAVGSNMCLNGTLDAAGNLTAGTVTANVPAPLNLCGVVGTYTAATATAAGALTLGTSNATIVAGTTLTAA